MRGDAASVPSTTPCLSLVDGKYRGAAGVKFTPFFLLFWEINRVRGGGGGGTGGGGCL